VSSEYKFIDLFAGVGGFHAGLNGTGRAHCVFASEWDRFARATYAHNFTVRTEGSPDDAGAPLFAGDITKVPPESIPDFDILCGGFPCQPFSHAGFKKGFSDTRGTLFFNIEKILQAKRPPAFFLENVRNLATHDEGRTIATIVRALVDCGYTAPAGGFVQVVKASDHGLPQHRPRCFIIGFLDPRAAAAFVSPPASPLAFTISDVMGGRVTLKRKSDAVRTIGYTLRVGGQASGIGDRHNWDTYLVNGLVKRLSVAQATRLQGFPEHFAFPKAITKTQAMKQLGNSVAVPAVRAWAGAIMNALDAIRSAPTPPRVPTNKPCPPALP
jgi:DNA (cytosine-5)-methyltransferase 1